ncbi:MAG: hypothetical protein ACOYD7_04380 [Raoultibacter sp.]
MAYTEFNFIPEALMSQFRHLVPKANKERVARLLLVTSNFDYRKRSILLPAELPFDYVLASWSCQPDWAPCMKIALEPA